MEGSHQKGSNWYRCQYVQRRSEAAAIYAEHPKVLGIKEAKLLEAILTFLGRRVFGPDRLNLLRDELADATQPGMSTRPTPTAGGRAGRDQPLTPRADATPRGARRPNAPNRRARSRADRRAQHTQERHHRCNQDPPGRATRRPQPRRSNGDARRRPRPPGNPSRSKPATARGDLQCLRRDDHLRQDQRTPQPRRNNHSRAGPRQQKRPPHRSGRGCLS
jgi:hypothetical protein